MRLMPEKFRIDFTLAFREPLTLKRVRKILFMGSWWMIYFGRLGEGTGCVARVARMCYLMMSRRRGIELTYSEKIGGGLLLAHAYSITVNTGVKTGRNVILYKGCTLGGIRSGNRKGVPVIGDNVVIGLNAMVVGGVRIGNDVFVAPGAFVNFDVPDHSVVVGNPGVVHAKEGATKDYFDAKLI